MLQNVLIGSLPIFQIYLKVDTYTSGPILDIGGMREFLRHTFRKKRVICFLASHKQIPYITISNENIFFQLKAPGL